MGWKDLHEGIKWGIIFFILFFSFSFLYYMLIPAYEEPYLSPKILVYSDFIGAILNIQDCQKLNCSGDYSMGWQPGWLVTAPPSWFIIGFILNWVLNKLLIIDLIWNRLISKFKK